MEVKSTTKFPQAERATLMAVYMDKNSVESNNYTNGIPQASCDITVSRPEVNGFFVPGEKYVVEFTKAGP